MSNKADENPTILFDWRIPRPSLHKSNRTNLTTATSNYERNIQSIYTLETIPGEKLDDERIDLPAENIWFSSGSSSSSNSTSSSQSDSSGALLLTTSNLNRVLQEALTLKSADTQSIASSTHFTLVNGVTLDKKQRHRRCWRRHQLAVLIITMTIILFFGILGAILFVEIRAMDLRHF